MEGLGKLLEREQHLTFAKKALKAGETPLLLTGLSNPHKCAVMGYLAQENKSDPCLVLTADDATAVKTAADLCALWGEGSAVSYPSKEFCFLDVREQSHEYEHARLRILSSLTAGGGAVRFVTASVTAALQYTIPKEILAARSRKIAPGDVQDLEELCAFFVKAGYVRVDQVEGPGQFARRGGLLDFYSPQMPLPFRVEFWDDEIDSISTFQIESQRRIDTVKYGMITPAAEVAPEDGAQMKQLLQRALKSLTGAKNKLAQERLEHLINDLENGVTPASYDSFLPLIYEAPAILTDYFTDGMIFYCEPGACRETLRGMETQEREDTKLLMEQGILFKGCTKFSGDLTDLQLAVEGSTSVLMDAFPRSVGEIKLRHLISVEHAGALSNWSGQMSVLTETLTEYTSQKYDVVLFAATEKTQIALMNDLRENGFVVTDERGMSEMIGGQVCVVPGSMSGGFVFGGAHLAVLSQGRIVPAARKIPTKHKPGKRLRDISDLTVGDYVVHSAHGIGIFKGIVKRESEGIVKDFIQIQYAGTDMLFVPVTQLDMVTRYGGAAQEGDIRLNSLNTGQWQRTRAKVKAAVQEMAKELVALYAKRDGSQGFAFSPDDDWQRDFELRFPYDETDDQLRCISEIKRDMESYRPMDRLLCGDVGFGKTEVALRAAFKAMLDSKQVALLCPTTILAWQHYQTVTRRMDGFPLRIELLSRFKTPREQKKILSDLKAGLVDMVIGTHRILQKDVGFKDLGLCIIDEEQRFGVRHKERFKELRENVDVLNLSATPIPRTLNMAMSGIRDMSVLEEAPQDRHPVQTYVLEHDRGMLIQAIQRELRRGGQVFYLHNRVDSIFGVARWIGEYLPEARIAVAHGKMSEQELSSVWQGLLEQEIDILVCTTIIETGVDVPNCNTLIIEDADRMGLSQLYQLRGRVGRSSRRAYAYFTFRQDKILTEIAAKRLNAIREFTAFGSGFRIAMRDLEIRGAGNLLGAQQHGHMESVGYDMYIRLLNEAVAQEKGEKAPAPVECMVDVAIGAHIPEDYIDNLPQRIDVYKKIAAVQDDEDASDLTDELIDRFGDPPKAVQGLIEVALIRGKAASAGITEISQRGDRMLFFTEQIQMEKAGKLASALRGRVMVSGGNKPYITVKMEKSDPLETIRDTLEAMNG